ncbi:MAG: efflux transporter outer membrane subunit [Holosporaceae bacterium]|jgi:multidrug efflux system outer membrane protein|nr:efflux transporter outer membrane subunit [Holosporaceae bacterium]
MRKKLLIIGFVPIIFLMGCEVGPDYLPPKLDLQAPDAKTAAADHDIDAFISEKWWKVFTDSSLDKLESSAIAHNYDLKQAIANIEEARAAVGVVAADLKPTVGAKISGDKTQVSRKTATPLRDTVDYLGVGSVSYELDFFGKYRRANEAARANLLSSRAAKDVVLLTVTADVAKTYFLLRALDAKLAIARRTLKTREESHRVYKSRLQNGYCTELDCLRIESDMASVEATVYNLEAAVAKTENALGVLIGDSPRKIMSQKITRGQSLEKLRIPSNIPNGIPSNLLLRRPDVLQAEGQLIAANAQIGEAMAMHFPSISLTGIFGFESKSLTDLFSSGSGLWKLSGGISLPIFSGGKISSLGAMAQARYQKTLALYEKTVQNAFREVLDALISRRKNSEIVVSRTRQMNALKKSYNIALTQKESGLIGMLDLLDVERGLLAAEIELVGALQNHLDSIVDLCKALGGGWRKDRLQ